MHADWKPPTVADTKRRFYETFRRPVAGIYNNVIQELLVQQHIMRYNRKYSYDAVRRSGGSVGAQFTSMGPWKSQSLPISISLQRPSGCIGINLHLLPDEH